MRRRFSIAWVCFLGLSILAISIPGCTAGHSKSFGDGIEWAAIDGKKLDEISGLVASRRDPGVLWVHNDGSKARLFAVSTNGQVLATFVLGTDVEDLEDIAAGPGSDQGSGFLYLGDIGDNKGQRHSIRVLRFAEPDLEVVKKRKKEPRIDEIQSLTLTYPGRPYNAETLLVDPVSGDLFIVTKEPRRARVFRASADRWKETGTVRLEYITQIQFKYVSGGDIAMDGSLIVLRREDSALLWKRRTGQSIPAALRTLAEVVPVIGPPREANGEAIGFTPGDSGYYTLGEGKNEMLFFFPRIDRSDSSLRAP